MKDRSNETKEDNAYEYPKTGDSEFVLSKAITGVNPKGAWLFGDRFHGFHGWRKTLRVHVVG
jgi:hypothetical protein|tara:strand:+ start:169 stop:354 length:186 start_codon:yes stop_codon:yes gene_type:complete